MPGEENVRRAELMVYDRSTGKLIRIDPRWQDESYLDVVRKGRTSVRMIERYPPEVNHDGWPMVVRALAENGGFALSEIDFTIFTQVRKPSIELVMDDLGLPMEKTHTVMEKWGYTGSACVGLAFDDAIRQGKVSAGDLVIFVGSGVGAFAVGSRASTHS